MVPRMAPSIVPRMVFRMVPKIVPSQVPRMVLALRGASKELAARLVMGLTEVSTVVRS